MLRIFADLFGLFSLLTNSHYASCTCLRNTNEGQFILRAYIMILKIHQYLNEHVY
jgi:hypothetical protein